ncbi:curli production assembly/transport component CsgG [Fodinibius roseus]|uniref:Curli production assembly/transport component CsgG n=2 Tax=Fodinibius roseus TaxID=1194090 RepID=A0A1M5AS53_9BACT|nr:curli production assembly/transport component CsgG [Fodinibius roseus]
MYKIPPTPLFLCLLLLAGCASSLQPLETERVKPGINSKVHESLTRMPAPQEKVVAAVYRFRDQTGQYKPTNRGASWSTAVTQGATSILIKSMEDSGWFTPIEREGISNLLNEREIISKTRQQNNQSGKLPPLLFGGVLLEGGIIGYDTNVITGGGGVRFLGTGGSGQFRKDQVTIYLRAVSTQNGRILKTVHTTKSIISQELESGAFRYVDTNRLLEAEAGFTYNEPPVMAVTEAIDEAVKTLVVEGVEEGIWSPENRTQYQQYRKDFEQVKEWKERAETNYFGMIQNSKLRSGFHLSTNLIFGSHIGSYPVSEKTAGIALQAEYFFGPGKSLKLNGHRSQIGAQDVFSEPYTNIDLTLNKYLAPDFSLSPYIGLGGGILMYDQQPDFTDRAFFPSANAEAGLDYRLSDNVGLRLGFNYRYLIEDGIDGVSRGSIHDQQWNISTGVSIGL